MKLLFKVCVVGLVGSSSIGANTNTQLVQPSTINGTVSSPENFTQLVAQDAVLYKEWQNILATLSGEFDRQDQLRNQVFKNIRAALCILKETMQKQHETSDSALTNAYAREQQLLQQLAALKAESSAEIKYLNDIIQGLSKDLAKARRAYKTPAHAPAADESTSALVDAKIDASDAYSTLATQHAEFLNALNAFVERTRVYLDATAVEIEALGHAAYTATQTPEL